MPSTNQNADKTTITAFTPMAKRRCYLQGSGIKDHSIIIFLSILHNEYCDGVYLQEILQQAMDKNNGLNVTCLITDEVYWHNLKGVNTSIADEAVLKQRAVELGLTFLQRNLTTFLTVMQQYNPTFSIETFHRDLGEKSILDQIKALNDLALVHKIPLQIALWKEWTTDEGYTAKKDQFLTLSQSIPELKEAIEETATSFAKRNVKRPVDDWDEMLASCDNNQKKFELLFRRAVDYVSEECFALYYLAGKRQINLIAYPGRMTKAFRKTQEFIITDTKTPQEYTGVRIQVDNPGFLANWISIDKTVLEEAVAQRKCEVEAQKKHLELEKLKTQTDSKMNDKTTSCDEVEKYYKNSSRFFFQIKDPQTDLSTLKNNSSSPFVNGILDILKALQSEPQYISIVEHFIEKFGRDESRRLAEQILELSIKNDGENSISITP